MASILHCLLVLSLLISDSFEVGISYKGLNLKNVPKRAENEFRRDVTALTNRLCLTGNLILRVPDNAFNGFSSLDYLELDDNRLTDVSSSAFNGTVISKLTLSRNRLSCIPDLSSIHKSITRLGIYSNRLHQCIKGVSYKVAFTKLEAISMDRNKLTHLCAMTLLWVSPNLRAVFLHDNDLTSVDNFPPVLNYLLRLRLTNNPIQCSCENKWLKQIATKGLEALACKPLGIIWKKLTYQDLASLCLSKTTAYVTGTLSCFSVLNTTFLVEIFHHKRIVSKIKDSI